MPAYPLAPDATVDDVLPWLERVDAATRDGTGGALAFFLVRRPAGTDRAAGRWYAGARPPDEVTVMVHVWMTRAIPEALPARRGLVRLLRSVGG